jgi:hypothetical protein
VDASRALGGRHALHAVHAALPLHRAVGAVAHHLEHRLLDPAQRALRPRDGLHPPPAPLDEARVHAHQVGREQRRLVAPGPGAHLDDARPVVERVPRDEQRLERALGAGDLVGEALDLAARLGRELGVVGAGELLGLGELALRALQPARLRHDLRQPRVLAPQLGETLGVARRVRVAEGTLDLVGALHRLAEAVAERAEPDRTSAHARRSGGTYARRRGGRGRRSTRGGRSAIGGRGRLAGGRHGRENLSGRTGPTTRRASLTGPSYCPPGGPRRNAAADRAFASGDPAHTPRPPAVDRPL